MVRLLNNSADARQLELMMWQSHTNKAAELCTWLLARWHAVGLSDELFTLVTGVMIVRGRPRV